MTKVNAELTFGATDQVFNGDSLTIVLTCPGGAPTITLSGPTDAEMNYSGNGDGGTAFGNLDDGMPANGTNITGGEGAGVTTFAYSTYASDFAVTGTLGFDNSPSHSSFGGCSFWGTVTSSS